MSENDEISGKAVVITLMTKRPWLIPFIYYIYTYSGLTIEELRKLVGVRTQIIKRALWWLAKNNIVEKRGEKHVIKEEYSKHIEKLLLDHCTTGKTHVLKIGKTYFVAIIRRTRISTYTVPEDLYNKLVEYELNVQTEFQPEDLANSLNIPIRLAHRVVALRRILRECRS
ncbi:hypothetical protein [Staphylothermus hellenicus]|uniref:Uncharacterized protein n=1 Tax=Staphylothermus hellenicus (strain DSM 12710 / JCM 10830 / BK20S6-10-b1 / P8) TaxID=591019 RepID=D7DA27_STAHD|nr:hypothetical protein [Staphylothermus hellenicus]ADI32623.1 hypothetical protein Shell_1535 [Staphylothermus hellenicus DSM 12710]